MLYEEMSIMVGHIALPEMSRKLRPGIKDEDIMPATLFIPEVPTIGISSLLLLMSVFYCF